MGGWAGRAPKRRTSISSEAFAPMSSPALGRTRKFREGNTRFKMRAQANHFLGKDRGAHLDSEMSTPVGFEPTLAEPIGLASGRHRKKMPRRDQEQSTIMTRTDQEHSKNRASTEQEQNKNRTRTEQEQSKIRARTEQEHRKSKERTEQEEITINAIPEQEQCNGKASATQEQKKSRAKTQQEQSNHTARAVQ